MPESRTRAEHLQWCKDRALAYLQPERAVATEANNLGERFYRYADGRYRERPTAEVAPQQVADALASFLSDLGKHSQTASHMAIQLSGLEMLGGGLRTADQVRRFIEGCN